MVLSPTLFPLPVEPAMRRCGMAARSETTGLPVVSLPRARGRRPLASTNSGETRISRRYTVVVSGFGTSTATVPRPGMGPMIRTAAAFMARARSSERFTTWLTFTPAAGSNSYEVMTGPGLACTMCPPTPKSSSFFLSVWALASSSSRVRLSSDDGGAWSSPTGGSWKARAPSLPKSKVSCQASPFSTSEPLGLGGSLTTSFGASSASSAATAGSQRGARDEENGHRDDGEEDDPRPDVAHGDAERLGDAPAQHAALVDTLDGQGIAEPRENAGDADQEQSEADRGGPARDHAGADEGGRAVAREEQRKKIARVAEGPEERPAQPDANGADGARLVHE